MNKRFLYNSCLSKKGFTLLEILLVVGIIAILAAIVIIAINPSRQLATVRNTQRKFDLKQIDSAIQQYYIDNNVYPDTIPTELNEICNTGTATSTDAFPPGYCADLVDLTMLVPTYFVAVPADPLANTVSLIPTAYAAENGTSYYVSREGVRSIILVASLTEINDDGIDIALGTTTASLNEEPPTIPSFTCGDSVNFTYNGSPVTYGTVYNAITTKCWLDRNLGATQVALSSTDTAAYGDLFQWGRSADGHQIRTSDTTSNLSSTDTPVAPENNKFILAPNNPYDWRSPQNTNLWQGVSGINNPCPIGFRIPTQTELSAERLSWGENNSAGAFASPLKLTTTGVRHFGSGSINSVGSNGSYWSSNINSTDSRNLYFNDSSGGDSIAYRAYGLAIRCIKD